MVICQLGMVMNVIVSKYTQVTPAPNHAGAKRHHFPLTPLRFFAFRTHMHTITLAPLLVVLVTRPP